MCGRRETGSTCWLRPPALSNGQHLQGVTISTTSNDSLTPINAARGNSWRRGVTVQTVGNTPLTSVPSHRAMGRPGEGAETADGFRMRSITCDSVVMAARTFNSPSQLGPCSRPMSTTRVSRRCQLRRAGPWCAQAARSTPTVTSSLVSFRFGGPGCSTAHGRECRRRSSACEPVHPDDS